MSLKKDITEAKAQFFSLVERAPRGEELTISKAGKPVAKLVPFERKDITRAPDQLKGKIKIANDFDEPPKDFIKFFE